MRPLIVIAVIVTLTAFYFANNVLPHTNLRFTTLLFSVKQQRPELILQEGVFTNEMDGYSIKIGSKNSKTNMLYNMLIYDHTRNRSNESVTVADSGAIHITEDKKYMVLDLYNGVNYSEDNSNSRTRKEKEKYPFRRDKFEKQTIRVRVRNFDFNRRDENIFKNTYRMLNINQLTESEDSLNGDYTKRLRTYLTQININLPISRKIYDLTAPHDSLKRNIVIKVDSTFNYDNYFEGVDKWVKADIAQAALESARNNVQNLNMNQGLLYQKKKYINRHSMERHKKFTLSIAVFIFFFIGAPLGAIIRKGGLGMPVVVSILLFIAYYIVSMMGEKSAREDAWDMFNGMWFSTFIFLVVGVWLTYKAATDSAVMSTETYSKFFNKIGLDKIGEKLKDKKKIFKRYQKD